MHTKRFIALILALTILLLPTASALTPVLDGGAHFLGGTFDELRAPSEGFCAYRSGGVWGFVDASDGSIAIDAAYLEVGDFHGGAAAVKTSDGWHFINRFGAAVSDNFANLRDLSDGHAAVMAGDGGWGYLGDSFALVIGCDYADARDFCDGIAAVRDTNGWFFIDKNGHSLTDRRFAEVDDFTGELAAVRDGGCGVINRAGELVVDCEWEEASSGDGIVTLRGSDACAIVDGDGRVRYYTGFADIGEFSEGLAAVKVRDRWGFIDTDGELVIPAVYDEVDEFSNGLAAAVRAGTPGVINRQGGFTPLGGAVEIDGYTGAAFAIEFSGSAAISRADITYAALGLSEVDGGEGDRFAVRTDDGWRLLSASSRVMQSAQFPCASTWALDELRQAGKLALLDPLDGLDDWSGDITRAEFCAIAVRFYELVSGESPLPGAPFLDSSDPSVLRAAALGLVSGDGDGRFRPNDPLTREEAATVLCRLCRLIGFTPARLLDGSPSDMGAVSSWAVDSVLELYRAEVFRGDELSAFRPSGHFSAEAAAITLYRLLHAPGEIEKEAIK